MDKSIPKIAILFADVCNSTRLYEEHGDAIARADLAACIEMLSHVCAAFGGETVKTIGDEIMCAFEDPIKAGLASTEMQASLRRVCADGKFQTGALYIKIGWHYGAVLWRGEEMIGEAPITAQQVIGQANANEILTTKQTIDALPDALFARMHVVDRLQAKAWNGELVVYKIPWERSGDETQVHSVPVVNVMPARTELTLDYKGTIFHVDPANTHCRVGRGRNTDLQVNGNFTSRQHAEINYRNGRFNIRDESVNGIVIAYDDGSIKRLRREEGVLSGSGVIGFGAPPDEDPSGAVKFECS